MNEILAFLLDNIVIFIVGLSVLLIIILALKKKKTRYRVLNNPVGDKYDPGIMPNDSYPKQESDINNMF